MRFELIDQVIEDSESNMTAVKNVTAAEEYLADHFPTFPVLPGVFMLEAMIQTARKFLAKYHGQTSKGPWVLADVRNVRYGNMVRPGQQLVLNIELKKSDDAKFTFTGKGTVEDETAVTGKFSLEPLIV